MKICSVCGEVKPIEDFRLVVDKRVGTQYLFNKCNECFKMYRREYYRNKIAKPRQTIGDEFGRNCSKCGQYKLWNEFNKKADGARGHRSDCKECSKTSGRQLNNQKNGLARSGWTPEMKEVVIYLQDGVCANPGCGNLATHADHDHETGEARALLCHGCNVSLGLLKESLERITGLLEYAKQCHNVKLWLEEE